MDGNLLGQGLQLMLVGMGTVFAFLTLLVAATSLMSRLTMRFVATPPPAPGSAQAAGMQGDEVAAIAAALELHRRRR